MSTKRTVYVLAFAFALLAGCRFSAQPPADIVSMKLENPIELTITEGEVIAVPETDITIEATRVSEVCKEVPPPTCGDEVLLKLKQVAVSRGQAYYLKDSSSSVFFGNRVVITNIDGTAATLLVERRKETPGDRLGWVKEKNDTVGYLLQHPHTFEWISDPPPRMTINAASGSLYIQLDENLDTSLENFAKEYLTTFPTVVGLTETVIGSKKLLSATSYRPGGAEKIYFWSNPQGRKAMFFLDEENNPHLSDFYHIIDSFTFTDPSI